MNNEKLTNFSENSEKENKNTAKVVNIYDRAEIEKALSKSKPAEIINIYSERNPERKASIERGLHITNSALDVITYNISHKRSGAGQRA